MIAVSLAATADDSTGEDRDDRVVITGLGIIAPNGIGVEAYWNATLMGESGIRVIDRFDPSTYSRRVAGLTDINAKAHLPNRLLPQTDRMTRLALVAAEEAITDAGLRPEDLTGMEAGTMTAASGGGFEFGQKELEALWSKGGQYVSAYQSFAWFYPVNTGQISIRHSLRGPASTLVADQAGGLDVVGKARRHLREEARLMVSGGVDGSISPWSWICLIKSGTISPVDDPARAYLPFDQDAAGSVPGEGGALLVAEGAASAAGRGAHQYGEIAGYAATFDPRPGSGRPPGLRNAIELALADAEMSADDIDVVFADAAGSPAADRTEAEVLAAVFGARGVPVTAPKTMTGRLLGGGGPLDLATALLAMRDGVIPPTLTGERPAFADVLDLVTREPRPVPLSSALVVARGHGGFNSAMVLRAVR